MDDEKSSRDLRECYSSCKYNLLSQLQLFKVESMKKNKIMIIVFIQLLFCFIYQFCLAKTIYVQVNGNNETANGTESRPYTSIQQALNQAAGDDVVQVGKGTFYENIQWPAVNGIKLIGQGETETFIDGNEKGSVIRFEESLNGIIDNKTIIQDVTIQNGYNWATYKHGAGICCINSSPYISNVTISKNMYDFGGGIYCINFSLVLFDVIIKNNTGTNGGGFTCYDSTPFLNHITITDNFADFGGGILSHNSTLSLSHVIITKNFAFSGGSIHGLYGNNLNLSNVYISENSSKELGSVITIGGDNHFSKVIITNNSTDLNQSIEIFGDCEIMNSIFWNNTPMQWDFKYANKISVSVSAIQGGKDSFIKGDSTTIEWKTENLTPAILSGTITSQATNRQVSEVTIQVGVQIVQSDSNGQYEMFLFPEEQIISLSKTDYQDKLVKLDRLSSGENVINFQLQPSNSQPNTQPFMPSSPSPKDNAKTVSCNTSISWSGGDPDTSDSVVYDIFLGTSNPPPLLISNHKETTYSSLSMNCNETYYWKIIAKDQGNLTTEGPTWTFTTLKDEIKPEISSFSVMDMTTQNTTITNDRLVSLVFQANDNAGNIYRWFVSENSETPELSVLQSASNSPPNRYTIQSPADGSKHLYAWVLDHSLNISNPKQYDIVLDTQADLMVQEKNICTLDTSLNIKGTMEKGAIIKAASQTLIINKIIYPTETSWQIEVSSIIPGSHKVTLSLTDLAENAISEDISIHRSIPILAETMKDAETLIADGKSEMNITILLKDYENKTVCTNVDITLSTSLGVLTNDNLNITNGQSITSLIASDTLGLASIDIYYNGKLIGKDRIEMIPGPPQTIIFSSPTKQEILVDQASSLINIQLQDDYGHMADHFDPLYISLSSTSGNKGQFWSWTGTDFAWEKNESIAIVTENTNPFTIKFQSSEPGVFTITASDTAELLSSGTQTITVHLQPPEDPMELFVESASHDGVILGWQPNSEKNVSYLVYRSQTENGLFYQVNSSNIIFDIIQGNVFYTDTYIKEGITYCYKIKAITEGIPSEIYSNQIQTQVPSTDDYDIEFIKIKELIGNIGSDVRYSMIIHRKENFKGTIHMFCSGIPSTINYNFWIDGKPKGSAISDITPPILVDLLLTIKSASFVGVHNFNLSAQNVWDGGSSGIRKQDLSVHVIQRGEEGIYVGLEKDIIRYAEHARIYGGIVPPKKNVNVTLEIWDENSGISFSIDVTTASGGMFNNSEWLSIFKIGQYRLQASFIDNQSNHHSSNIKTFTIDKGEIVLTCMKKWKITPEINSDFGIIGKISPSIPDETIMLQITDPNNNISYKSLNTGIEGDQISITEKFFDAKGIWTFKMFWQGNNEYIGSESDYLIIPVDIDIGRAIILAGGEASLQNLYWNVTKKLALDAYRDFKYSGFNDDMILFAIHSEMADINYDEKSDDVVDIYPPTTEAFLNAIEQGFSQELDTDTPLYIYMQGHATQYGDFRVLGSDEQVTASQINRSLKYIQQQTGCKIILIIESCYSGTFIHSLKGPNRLIITSAGNETYQTDVKGDISFSRFFFSKLRDGRSIDKSFQIAKDNMVKLGYPCPIMDDNTKLASNLYLNSYLNWNIRPEIQQVNISPILEQNQSTVTLSGTAQGNDSTITCIRAQMIPPVSNNIQDELTIQYPEFDLTYTINTQTFAGALTGLYQPGIYKIVLIAENENHDTSEPEIIFINAKGTILPGDINSDTKRNLIDALLALKCLAGMDCNITFSTEADILGNDCVGLEEIVFLLKVISE